MFHVFVIFLVGALLAKTANVQVITEDREGAVRCRGGERIWSFLALRCCRGLREQSPYVWIEFISWARLVGGVIV